MQLRSLMRSLREHDWTTSILEFVLLVSGIFIGFQLDRWNDERLQQKEATEYSLQLMDDLMIELRDIETKIAYFEQVRDFGYVALTAWEDQSEATTEQLIIAFYQASNILPNTSVRGAYDALSSKGLLGLVDGPEFASSLSAYYGQDIEGTLFQATPYRLEVRGVLPNDVQDAIRRHCSNIKTVRLASESLADQCEIGLPQSRAVKILAALTNHPRMQFYLRQTISKETVSIYIWAIQRERLKRLSDRLRSLHAGTT